MSTIWNIFYGSYSGSPLNKLLYFFCYCWLSIYQVIFKHHLWQVCIKGESYSILQAISAIHERTALYVLLRQQLDSLITHGIQFEPL